MGTDDYTWQKIYVRGVEQEKITIVDVPQWWKAAVSELLLQQMN